MNPIPTINSSPLTANGLKVLALVLLTATCLGQPALALPGLDRTPGLNPTIPAQRPSLRRDELVDSSQRAVEMAEQRYDGRAVGARHVGNGLYRVRILQDNGKVKTVTVRPD